MGQHLILHDGRILVDVHLCRSLVKQQSAGNRRIRDLFNGNRRYFRNQHPSQRVSNRSINAHQFEHDFLFIQPQYGAFQSFPEPVQVQRII